MTLRAVARAPGSVGRGEVQHRAGRVRDLGGRRPRVPFGHTKFEMSVR